MKDSQSLFSKDCGREVVGRVGRQGGQLWLVLSRVLERPMAAGGRLRLGGIYVLWKCKDGNVCTDKGGRGLE